MSHSTHDQPSYEAEEGSPPNKSAQLFWSIPRLTTTSGSRLTWMCRIC